jgi:hypothetical protein
MTNEKALEILLNEFIPKYGWPLFPYKIHWELVERGISMRQFDLLINTLKRVWP